MLGMINLWLIQILPYSLDIQLGQKHKRCSTLENSTIYFSKDVKFFEDIFPLHSRRKNSSTPSNTSVLPTNSKDIHDHILSPSTPIITSFHDSNETQNAPLIRTSHTIHPPSYLHDYLCHNTNL